MILTCGLLQATDGLAADPANDAGYTPVSIGYAAERKPEGGAVHLGERVSVQGTVTTPTDVYRRSFNLVFMQDDQAAIALFDSRRRMPQVEPGDVLEVRGTVADYQGLVQIRVDSAEKVGRVRPPRPLDVTIEEAASPRFLSRLVRVKGRVEDVSERSGIRVDLATETDPGLSLYVYPHLSEQLRALDLKTGSVIRVTGILSQYDPIPPHASGWQVFPRDISDISVVSMPLVNTSMVRKAVVVVGLLGLAAVGWIVTLRRQVRRQTESLSQAVAVLKTQQEATLDGILITDAKARITSMNSRFEAIWRVDRSELEGLDFDQLITKRSEQFVDSEAFAERARALAASQSSVLAHEEFAMKDGRTLSISSLPVLSDDEFLGRAWYFQDVTRRKLLERQVEQANRVTGLGHLSAGIAHEFNNVLMGIQPFVDVLKPRSADDFSDQALHRIEEAVGRGRRITGEVLSFTRPIEPILKATSLREFFGAVHDELRSVFPSTVSLAIDLPADDLFILGDRELLTQVFVNLAANARDAMPDGGSVTISARKTEGRTEYPFGVVTDDGSFIHIEFTDSGSGIPPEIVPHVFEPLVTVKRSRGSGLGLAVVQQILTKHGGHVFVESTVGRGSTFHLFIKAAVRAELHQERPQERSARPAGDLLLVEDEPGVAEGITMNLQAHGLAVRSVGSGEDALVELDRAVPQAVILDVDLPGMSGVEVFEHLRRRWPLLPVVFSTAHHQPEKVAQCLGSGPVALLLKPYDTPTLLKTLAEVSGVDPTA